MPAQFVPGPIDMLCFAGKPLLHLCSIDCMLAALAAREAAVLASGMASLAMQAITSFAFAARSVQAESHSAAFASLIHFGAQLLARHGYANPAWLHAPATKGERHWISSLCAVASACRSKLSIHKEHPMASISVTHRHPDNALF